MVVLRDYQEDLIDKAINSLRSHDRTLVVSPCGSGKSYLFAKMVEMTTSGYCLILTHRGELKDQHEKLLTDLGLTNWRVGMVMTEANHLGENGTPRLVIADEAHLSRAKSWEKVINYYNVKTAGFTATPCRLDGKPLGDVYDDLVQGISVKDLIERKRLAPYKYYAPFEVDTAGLKVVAGDYRKDDLERLMTDRAIYGNVFESWVKISPSRKTIAYCVTIKHANEVAEMFRSHGIAAKAVSADTTNRAEIMNDFRNGKITVLCNVGIISEGISIDDVECCLLLRPTESLALHIQQSQRCMRYMDGKTAKIIDCVGNYTRHGLPDDDQEWSLTRTIRKRKITDDHGNLFVRMCPYCYQTFKAAPKCPYCGMEYPLSQRELKAHEEIELQEINVQMMEQVRETKKRMRMEVGRARTLEDLWKIANERGYNPGWIYRQARLKGIRI